jgi:hypothetical protein
MHGWKLSLRDVFLIITSLAISLGMFVMYMQLPEVREAGDVVLPFGIKVVGFLCLAVSLSDTRRYAALLAFAIVAVSFDAFASFRFSPVYAWLFGEVDPRATFYRLTEASVAFYLAGLCSFVTRSLSNRDNTGRRF